MIRLALAALLLWPAVAGADALIAARIVNQPNVSCDGQVRAVGYANIGAEPWEIYSITLVAQPERGSGRWEIKVGLSAVGGIPDPWAWEGNVNAVFARTVDWGGSAYVLPPGPTLRAEYACWGGGSKNFSVTIHYASDP